MSDTAVINVNLPQKEDPLAVLWRKHFHSMAEGDWNSVEAVSAHISKFYQLLVSDGLEGSRFSKLPDEILEMISSMPEHKERDVAPPASGIKDLRQVSNAVMPATNTNTPPSADSEATPMTKTATELAAELAATMPGLGNGASRIGATPSPTEKKPPRALDSGPANVARSLLFSDGLVEDEGNSEWL